MKNSTILNSDRHIFCVKFMWKATDGKFILHGEQLAEAVKAHGEKGIEYIKMFDPADNKFKRVSKSQILAFQSWNTESFEYLKNHSYFKK